MPVMEGLGVIAGYDWEGRVVSVPENDIDFALRGLPLICVD